MPEATIEISKVTRVDQGAWKIEGNHGLKAWVRDHPVLSKNTFRHFVIAGFAALFRELSQGETVSLDEPIIAEMMQFPGQAWEVTRVYRPQP